jgi:hypothetical protein
VPQALSDDDEHSVTEENLNPDWKNLTVGIGEDCSGGQ